jgi:hypothetical protein
MQNLILALLLIAIILKRGWEESVWLTGFGDAEWSRAYEAAAGVSWGQAAVATKPSRPAADHSSSAI